MNIFIQWQETISDAYLTDTPSYFPLIEPNISLLPQGSLASIPSNGLIFSIVLQCLNSEVTKSQRNGRRQRRRQILRKCIQSLENFIILKLLNDMNLDLYPLMSSSLLTRKTKDNKFIRFQSCTFVLLRT